MVADYELLRKGDFRWSRVKTVHEKEVHVPEELCFPFAEARQRALKNMSPDAAPPKIGLVPLPYSDEPGADGDLPPAFIPAPVVPRFRITLSRLIEHGVTPGCKGCENLATDKPRPHTELCKKRFAELLDVAPVVTVVGTKAIVGWVAWAKALSSIASGRSAAWFESIARNAARILAACTVV